MMIASIVFGFFTNVLAYSPHYLPGGDNYLCADNFHTVDGYYQTMDPFLVKPDMEYLLTIPRSYMENGYPETHIEFYNNAELVDSMDFLPQNYQLLFEDNVAYVTFITPSEGNYLSLSFFEGEEFFVDATESSGIMLEEGSIFDGYEVYSPGTVIDTDAPYFQSAGTVVSYVDDPITVSEIQSALKAYDAINGDVTSRIQLVTDNYTEHDDTIGTYTVVFSVSDLSDNTNEITIQVTVVDMVEPVFTDIGLVKAVYPTAYTEEALLAMCHASDNYDGDISQSIDVVSNDYSVSSQILGRYEVELSATDSSGNTAFYTLEIDVVDEDAPIFSGISSVVIGYDELLTEAGIKADISVIDNYDSLESLSIELIEDTYTAHHRILGNYQMVFQTVDSSGNTSSKTVSIQVIDQIGPVVYYDSAVIQVYTDRVLTLGEITSLLTYSKEIDSNKTYQVTVDYDSYSRHKTTAGTYHLSLRFEDESGQIMTKDLQVIVKERSGIPVETPETKPETMDAGFFQHPQQMILGGLGALCVGTNLIWWKILRKKKI